MASETEIEIPDPGGRHHENPTDVSGMFPDVQSGRGTRRALAGEVRGMHRCGYVHTVEDDIALRDDD